MRSMILLFVFVALAAAAIQNLPQPNPVYHRAVTVVNSSPLPSGKSLPTSPNINSNPMSNSQISQTQQPIAEERDSGFITADASNAGQIGSAVPSTPVAGNPQTFKILYYPNTDQLSNQQNGVYGTTYAPQSKDLNFWQRYHMNEVLVGVASLALVVGGGAILYPKFVNVRARALRELADINSEDAARMTKSVFKALERLYEMNNAE